MVLVKSEITKRTQKRPSLFIVWITFLVFKDYLLLHSASAASTEARVFRYKTICNECLVRGLCARRKAALCGMPDAVLHNRVTFSVSNDLEQLYFFARVAVNVDVIFAVAHHALELIANVVFVVFFD